MRKFPIYRQIEQMDCGPTCLKMIAKYYGKSYSIQTLRDKSFMTLNGVSMLYIRQTAEAIGFKTLAVDITFEQLVEKAPLPCILYWRQNHFVVLPPQKKLRHTKKIRIADPAFGMIKIDRQIFLQSWATTGSGKGAALLLEPGTAFFSNDEKRTEVKGINFLKKYLHPHLPSLGRVFATLLLGSLFAIIFPFLTQSLVDHGINHRNVGFIYLILASQLALFVGTTFIEIIRSWILLHVNTRVNISIISDFLIKLMKLPIRFFDTKKIAEISQRIHDQERLELFLTSTTMNTAFSLVNLVVFSIVLAIYSTTILAFFLIGTALSLVWIIIFLGRRKSLDYLRFQRLTENQTAIYELISGMQEIKLNTSELFKRWEWEKIQVKLFKLNERSLRLEQYQSVGSTFFSQLKNIIITYVAAMETINGSITLGMMLSISFIIGQLNGPLDQLIFFLRNAQDAKISLERLAEIQNKDDEEPAPSGYNNYEAVENAYLVSHGSKSSVNAHGLFEAPGIVINNLSYRYDGPNSPLVLNGVKLQVPEAKVTAIVGSSGSGKTTLMKMLLKFYEPTAGEITVNNRSLSDISAGAWRRRCGVVMQEGYIFSDTIAGNIAVGLDRYDTDRLMHAVEVANIHAFVRKLPLGFNTRIGATGAGLSSGQKQRILIARAVYKNPDYLFLDEATSALDASNERVIIDNLNAFFRGKTVVVIAHRLSTVRDADQIIVLNEGQVAEVGTHTTLSQQKGRYYDLVKNQLELGV